MVDTAGTPPGLDSEAFRKIGYQAVDIAAAYLQSLGQRDAPVYQPMSLEERQRVFDFAMPEDGEEPATILERFEREILPFPMGNGHPRFFGWVNSPPAPMGIIAGLLATAMNPSCAGGNHAAIYLEHAVTGWLMDLLGFPRQGSTGLLVSGGSMASLTCLTAARHAAVREAGGNVRHDGLQGRDSPLVLYLAAEGHTTMLKAAELLGIGRENVRIIPVDERYRMKVDELREAVRADREAGREPFCVAASAGTASTGAIDPLDEIAMICEGEQLWFHVDGAYGAPGVLDPGAASLFTGMERADSLAVDPHKWLSVPIECGVALVRDKDLLRETFSLVPAYVATEEGKGIGDLPWFSEYGFQQTRGFRALKLWMTLAHTGRRGLVEHISRGNRQARSLAEMIHEAPDFEVVTDPTLSIVCFRYIPDGLRDDLDGLDALNRRIMYRVQESGELFLTNADLGGRFALRACFVNYLTNDDDVRAVLPLIRKIAAQIE